MEKIQVNNILIIYLNALYVKTNFFFTLNSFRYFFLFSVLFVIFFVLVFTIWLQNEFKKKREVGNRYIYKEEEIQNDLSSMWAASKPFFVTFDCGCKSDWRKSWICSLEYGSIWMPETHTSLKS